MPLNCFPSPGIWAEPSTTGTPGAHGCESDGFTATRLEPQILQEVGQGSLQRKISTSTHNRGIHSRFSLQAKDTSVFVFSFSCASGTEGTHEQMQVTLTQQLARAFFSLSKLWLNLVVFHFMEKWHLQSSSPADCTPADRKVPGKRRGH